MTYSKPCPSAWNPLVKRRVSSVSAAEGSTGGGVPAGERGAEGVPRPGGAGAEGAPPPPRGLLGWGRGAWDAAGGHFPGGASGVRSLQMEGGVLESGRFASIYLPGAAAPVGCGRRHQNETLAEAWVGGS